MIALRLRATVTVFDQIEKCGTTLAGQAAAYLEKLQGMRLFSALLGMADVQEQLSIAGNPVSLEVFQAIRLMCLVVGLLSAGIAIVTGSWYLVVLAALVKAPEIWLSVIISGRRTRMKREFLTVATRLSTAFTAGLDTQRALEWAGRNIGSGDALRHELRQALERLRMGAPLDTVLNEFSSRTRLLDAHRMSTVIVQAQRYGDSVSARLLDAVRDARERRKAEIIGQAKTAEQKLQLAIILMALPTVICTLGPLLISLVSQGGLGF
jgi:Flp pilus assembly protein TadB